MKLQDSLTFPFTCSMAEVGSWPCECARCRYSDEKASEKFESALTEEKHRELVAKAKARGLKALLTNLNPEDKGDGGHQKVLEFIMKMGWKEVFHYKGNSGEERDVYTYMLELPQ